MDETSGRQDGAVRDAMDGWPTNRIEQGDALRTVRRWPAESVHLFLFSVPYYMQRDYQVSGESLSGQWGQEPTVELYVQRLVGFMRVVRRKLHPMGSVVINIGDCFAGSAQRRQGIKPKDRMLIPSRVALALQADGWWLRQGPGDAPWIKMNGLPESAGDRPTSSTEQLLLLTKGPAYYWDQEAVQQRRTDVRETGGGAHIRGAWWWRAALALLPRTAVLWLGGPDGEPLGVLLPTFPYPGAHYATFPPELVRPWVRACTSEHGACPACGAPWVRATKAESVGHASNEYAGKNKQADHHAAGRRALAYKKARGARVPHDADLTGKQVDRNGAQTRVALARDALRARGVRHDNPFSAPETIGWQPGCACDAGEPMPCIVADPFAGAGTTLMVARQEGRRAAGVDLAGGEAPLGIIKGRAPGPPWHHRITDTTDDPRGYKLNTWKAWTADPTYPDVLQYRKGSEWVWNHHTANDRIAAAEQGRPLAQYQEQEAVGQMDLLEMAEAAGHA